MFNGLQGGATATLLQNAAPVQKVQNAAPIQHFQNAAPVHYYQPVVAPPQASGGVVLGANTTYQPPDNSAQIAAQHNAQLAAEQAQRDAQAASYDQGIGNVNSALGRLPGQQDVVLGNIDTAYNSAFNQLLQGKARGQSAYDTAGSQALQDYNLGKTQATQGYNTAKTQTGQDYVGSKNTIGSNAGSSLNSLMRLLGSRGAGGSSAALFNAPQAVARQATIQRNDVGQTFGRNQQALDTGYNTGIANMDQTYGRNKNALDTNWNNYLSDYGQSATDLSNQRTNNQSALQATINSNRANLLQQLANFTTRRGFLSGASPGDAIASAQPYLDQANQLISQADAAGRQVPVSINAHPASYNAPQLAAQTPYTPPSLASYTVNPNAAPTYQNQNQGANDFLTPYLASLLGKQKLPGTIGSTAATSIPVAG